MLQFQIWGRGTGNAGEWKALTQGTQGKKTKNCRSIPAASSSPVFALSVAATNMTPTKFKWGQSVAWLISGIIFSTLHRGAAFAPLPNLQASAERTKN